MAPPSGSIYSATYSNVPVFEYNIEGNHVMRRRHDDWINATHILKVADYDKPQRTRILEREVQKGVHEKVQGGYGKYQGTWVPLHDGKALAERNRVLHKLQAIFDYIPGDKSPPQAPKHATNKPKLPRAMPPAKKQKTKLRPNASQISDDPYENISVQLNDDESMENSSMISGSYMDEEDIYRNGQAGGSRKRKRAAEVAIAEQHHQMYGDALLDYFVVASDDAPPGGIEPMPPVPPPGYPPDRAIDDQHHTALHWAAAMGDMPTVRIFLERNADVCARNMRGETPMIRGVIFTNNYEKGTMGQLVDLLKDAICVQDNFNGTILHHVAQTTGSNSRKKSARHYLEVLLNKLNQLLPPHEFLNFLNARDLKGDTALHIVARNDSRKCVRTLLGRGAVSDLLNNNRETADQLIHLTRATRHDDYILASSSPIQGEIALTNGYTDHRPSSHALITQASPNYTTTAARSFSSSFGPLISGKGVQIALALDSEVQDKDVDLTEASRLSQKAEHERHLVRQKTFALMTSMDVGEDEQEYEDLARESEDLKGTSESYLEQSQHRELHGEVRTEEQKLPAEVHRPKSNGVAVLSDDSMTEKMLSGFELSTEQRQRENLVGSVAQAQATAGMSAKGESCKELIASLTGVSQAGVVALVPELLEELEMAKMDGGGKVVVVV